jgi:hypothetical protein
MPFHSPSNCARIAVLKLCPTSLFTARVRDHNRRGSCNMISSKIRLNRINWVLFRLFNHAVSTPGAIWSKVGWQLNGGWIRILNKLSLPISRYWTDIRQDSNLPTESEQRCRCTNRRFQNSNTCTLAYLLRKQETAYRNNQHLGS